MIDVEEKKRKIIAFLENTGPSLPVRIAKAIEMEPVFASAILSELIGERKVKTSHLRIGASPLYLLFGQEQKLENFAENLKSSEKEAYQKLKSKKVLSDENEPPTIRVALRSMKDFAVPFDFEGKLLWQYAFCSDEEIKEILLPKKTHEKVIETKRIEEEKIGEETLEEKVEPNAEEKKESSEEKEVPKAWKEKKEEIKKLKQESRKEKSPEDPLEEETEFSREIAEFLKSKKIEIVEEIQSDKKENVSKIKIKTVLGELNFLLIAKNKKSATVDEINSALKRSMYEKMPCLFLTRKEPSKKIQSLFESNNLVKFESLEDQS